MVLSARSADWTVNTSAVSFRLRGLFFLYPFELNLSSLVRLCSATSRSLWHARWWKEPDITSFKSNTDLYADIRDVATCGDTVAIAIARTGTRPKEGVRCVPSETSRESVDGFFPSDDGSEHSQPRLSNLCCTTSWWDAGWTFHVDRNFVRSDLP